MFVIPSILITTPIFDDSDCVIPSITVTRDSADVIETEDLIHNPEDIPADPHSAAEDFSIFPDSLFQAARLVFHTFMIYGFMVMLFSDPVIQRKSRTLKILS